MNRKHTTETEHFLFTVGVMLILFSVGYGLLTLLELLGVTL